MVIAASTPPQDDTRVFRELVQRIAERDLPAFGATLAELSRIADEDAYSGRQLVELVLRDPALTAMVLRAANAAYLGLAGRARVATVSRAVVVLGINALKSLCVSAMAVENLSAGNAYRHRVAEATGRALHAGVQARDLGAALGLRRDEAEKHFVSALLSSVGEMAFWCHGEPHAGRLEAALKSGMAASDAEQAILGMSLRQFGRDLLRIWKLDGLLIDSPEVERARQLSLHTRDGWNLAATMRAVQSVADMLGQPDAEVMRRLQANAREAAALAAALGIPEAARYILPPEERDDAAREEAPQAAPRVYPEEDAAQQARLLADLEDVARSRRDLPMLFGTCLEGMCRGAGLDRCVLCLIAPTRTQLAARLSAGLDAGGLRERLQWPWTPEIEAELQPGMVRLYSAAKPPPRFLRQAGCIDCIVATLTVDQRVIGLFYADRIPSGRPLKPSQEEEFRRFVAQTERIVSRLPKE